MFFLKFCGRSSVTLLGSSVMKCTLSHEVKKCNIYCSSAFHQLSLNSLVKQNFIRSVFNKIPSKYVSLNIPQQICASRTFSQLTKSGDVFRTKKTSLVDLKTISPSGWRFASSGGYHRGKSHKSSVIYIIAVFIFMVGGSYAAVPLYKVFCQATGLGGQAVKGHDTAKIENMVKVERPIVVTFNADVASSMRWNFRPQQTEVAVYPGETALAFYTAKNPTDVPIIGISTYNILPYEAGQYFNKIQCFCFEEQRLNPNEQVDMPVFFFIDPEYDEDPKLEHVDKITLSYTFFEAREGLKLPLPGYAQPHEPPPAATAAA